MRSVESNCVGCGLPCVPYCSYNRSSVVCTCDKCKAEVDVLYQIGDDELCRDCAIEECKEDIVDCYADEYLYDLIIKEDEE